MAVHSIKLPSGIWEFDDAALLGRAGGFGEVFRGSGISGAVAIKRLKLSAGHAAYREMRIGDRLLGHNFKNVVPIFDAGQDAQSDRYFLVMPICERNLQDDIDASAGGLSLEAAMLAIRSILLGLLEIEEITHRDLKPANVLYHDGIWKIADFGIAKFVEDSTSLETLRESLTPAYAAPEQWQNERPTSATDVYALGCIIHALCDGHPPFRGSVDDLREKHLRKVPNLVARLPPRLSAFVAHMLRKPPASRPTLERCKAVFDVLELEKKVNSAARIRLVTAAGVVAEIEAKNDIERRQEEVKLKERADLISLSRVELSQMRDRLFSELNESSESVARDKSDLLFGFAHLKFGTMIEEVDDFFKVHSAVKNSGWDVLISSTISVTVDKYYTWAASLIFADNSGGEGYRWYEVGFWSTARHSPFALSGRSVEFYVALSLGARLIPGSHSFRVAYGPLPIDGENEHEFIDRWIELVAKGATKELEQPKKFPIQFLHR